MSQFQESEQDLASVRGLDPETKEAPKERISSPDAARAIFKKLEDDDSDSSYNRSLVQEQMDFIPPHDDAELEEKGQADRFNITTGEGPAIKNEAVAAYLDIFTTPKMIAKIPLKEVGYDKNDASRWQNIMAEEFTVMVRSDDRSLPCFLQLADTYVTHGVAVAFFDDKEKMQYSVSGLDQFKFPRSTGIISSEVDLAVAKGKMSVTELYAKIEDGDAGHWNEEAVKQAIIDAGDVANLEDWDDWESIQRQIKSNDAYVSSICDKIEIINLWVKEFSGKMSFYVAAKRPLGKDSDRKNKKEEFLFKAPGLYDSVEEAFQLFPFSVGNGSMLYTVRGLGYLIYQICNAMDIMHNKLLDNARVGSSLIVQPGSVEDLQDIQLIDAGGFLTIPPSMQIPERQMSQNLNNSLIPAIQESRRILDRATGGIASGNMMMNNESDRRTKLEVSSQLDYINKLNSFAISMFYGPYDKVIREMVRRAFTVHQKDKSTRDRIKEMKERCVARGVPEGAFKNIDLKAVAATRIIGTGSRASRLMLMDQVQKYYSTWDDVGRNNFDYDSLVELIGVDKAERYAGKPDENRVPYDHDIAVLETQVLLDGETIEPRDGQNHMVHIPVHLESLETEFQSVETGELDLMEWTLEYNQLYEHTLATIEMTTVHETMQPTLNSYNQRLQRVSEMVINGMRMIEKAKRNGEFEEPQEGEESQKQDAEASKAKREMKEKEMLHAQKMKHIFEEGRLRLQQAREMGQQKQVLESQKAMGQMISRNAEAQAKIQQAKLKSV